MLSPNSDGVCCITRRSLRLGALIVLLGFVMPATTFASSPDPDDPNPELCIQCHPAEAAVWGDSPHAHALETIDAALHTDGSRTLSLEDCDCLRCHTTGLDPGEDPYTHAGVTCEACHGPYVQGHPQNGVMQLKVDASTCRDCHTSTYEQWHATAHFGAEIQCISCHVPHTQETRLENSALCESCHREGAEHEVHHEAGVHCADCHLSSPAAPDSAGDVRVMAGGAAPQHTFELAVESCANCHAESIHENVLNVATHEIPSAQVSEMKARAQELANQLEETKRTNRSLQAMSVASLGFGLGSGGVLGVILALVVGYIVQGRTKR